MMRLLSSMLALILAASLSAAEPTRRPNVILIMADDLGYECIGANGGTSYQTPVLDQLAANGMRFEHCHVQPLCTPTRVQLMTGIYNVRNYLTFGNMEPKSFTSVTRSGRRVMRRGSRASGSWDRMPLCRASLASTSSVSGSIPAVRRAMRTLGWRSTAWRKTSPMGNMVQTW